MPFSRRTFIGSGMMAAMGALAENPSEADSDETAGNAEASAAASPDLADPNYESAAHRDLASDAIHVGQESGFSATPIYPGKNYKGQYQRPATNPTVKSLEAKLTQLEGGADATSASCGMGIIGAAYLALVRAGDRVVAHRCNYDAVMELFRDRLPRLGVEVVLIDMNRPDELKKALAAKKTKIVHWEPYVNPTMEVLPSPTIIELARQHGALTVVDNTWLTPYLYQPLRAGVDLVLHSATKYIGGHGSAMGGVAIGRDAELVRQLRRTSRVFGGLLRPFDAFLLDQGLKTLPMRVERHTASARRVALWLEDHPKVHRVRYGGLESWQKRQTGEPYVRGYGGMIGVEWKDGRTHGQFHTRLKMCKHWGSLGDVVTLVHSYRPEPDRGIPPRYTRIAVGLEHPDDIIADFQQALERI